MPCMRSNAGGNERKRLFNSKKVEKKPIKILAGILVFCIVIAAGLAIYQVRRIAANKEYQKYLQDG